MTAVFYAATAAIRVLMAPFWLKFIPWSSVYALFFQAAAVWFLLRFVEAGGIGWAAAVGLATVCVYGFREPVGLFFAWLDANGALDDWYVQTKLAARLAVLGDHRLETLSDLKEAGFHLAKTLSHALLGGRC